MNTEKRAYAELHLAIFLFGFTAILGRLIELNGFEIVWYRMLITFISIFFLPKFIRGIKAIPAPHRWRLAGIGILVSLHWAAFFASIKFSNVTVALSVLATSAFFTSLLEPLIFREKVKKEELLLGLLVIAGMYLIFSFGGGYLYGILLGLAAAFLASLFAILNRKMVSRYQPMGITFIEMGSGWLFLTLLLPVYWWWYGTTFPMPGWNDLFYLLILAILCTTLAYVLALRALRYVTAFTANLSINMEPVYGIVLAFFIFQENQELDNRFYIGSIIILLSIFIHTWLARRRRKKAAVAL